MTIQLYSGSVLLNTGAVAVSSACCCSSCDCTAAPLPAPDLCTECATGDFPTSYSGVPRGWQLDISGVTASGSNSGCVSPACAVAAHPAFFNRSILFDPCPAGPTVDYECIYLCQGGADGVGGTFFYFEWNYLDAIAGVGYWQASVRLVSEILAFSRPVGTDPGTICSAVASNMAASSTNGGSGYANVRSRVRFDQTLLRAAPTFQQYSWNTTSCPPATCTNPITNVSGACYPAAWALTANAATYAWNDTCHAANDVTAASVSAYSV